MWGEEQPSLLPNLGPGPAVAFSSSLFEVKLPGEGGCFRGRKDQGLANVRGCKLLLAQIYTSTCQHGLDSTCTSKNPTEEDGETGENS